MATYPAPTEEPQRRFKAEQAAKRKRREEYARLNEESALKCRLTEHEADEKYYKNSIAKKAESAEKLMEQIEAGTNQPVKL